MRERSALEAANQKRSTMVSNHLELELIAKQIHEARVREADAARQIAAACVTTSIAQRWPSLVSIAGGKRVRWWFWSRFTSQKAPAAPSTLVNANERSATL